MTAGDFSASVLDHGGSWVQVSYGARIFPSSHLTLHNIHVFLTLLAWVIALERCKFRPVQEFLVSVQQPKRSQTGLM